LPWLASINKPKLLIFTNGQTVRREERIERRESEERAEREREERKEEREEKRNSAKFSSSLSTSFIFSPIEYLKHRENNMCCW
jgi:cytidylate kinase